MSDSCACLDHVVGETARREFTVGATDTAIALGSGSVNVLATPMAIAWCEAATTAALAPAICSNCTTVGYKIEFAHLLPTLVGEVVYASALVESVSGDRIVFSIELGSELGSAQVQVGKGKITRVRVDRSAWAN
jgi:fluoroacetyl-CoA thioesterase